MADRDAKKVERQLDRISAGLPSGVGGFLRWLRSPLSRWVRIPAGLLLIIGGVVGFVGVGILDGAAWRPAACAGPPLPPTAGNENVSNGRVRGHVYRGTGILNNRPRAFGNTLSPNGQETQEQVPRGKKRAVQNPAETHLQTVSGDVRFGSLADTLTSPRHVRFTPNNGRWTAKSAFGYRLHAPTAYRAAPGCS
jgi:hypothetical protein